MTGRPGRLIDRRVSGGLVLVTALLVALVVPEMLNPPRTDGRVSMAPPPPPPVVGDCIDRSYSGFAMSGDGRLDMDGPFLVVPCSEPHGGEIVRVEDVPPRATSFDDLGPVGDLMDSCGTDSLSVLAPSDDSWRQQLNITIGVIGPDDRQTAAGQIWTGCTVGLFRGQLAQPLNSVSVDGQAPPLLGVCSNQDHRQSQSYTETDCKAPHNHEDLGYRQIPAGSPLTQDEMIRSCTEMAVRATGRVELTTDPGIEIETKAWAWYESGEGGVVTLPVPADADGGGATCALHTTGGRQLTTSLRQFGDGPLPLAN